jgi:hypothetical protein
MNKELEEVAETIAKGFGSENWQEIKDGIIRYAIDDKQQEKLFSEEDMIDFAEFIASYSDKNRNIHNEMLHAKSKYDGAERTIDLLKIWLKESKTK